MCAGACVCECVFSIEVLRCPKLKQKTDRLHQVSNRNSCNQNPALRQAYMLSYFKREREKYYSTKAALAISEREEKMSGGRKTKRRELSKKEKKGTKKFVETPGQHISFWPRLEIASPAAALHQKGIAKLFAAQHELRPRCVSCEAVQPAASARADPPYWVYTFNRQERRRGG